MKILVFYVDEETGRRRWIPFSMIRDGRSGVYGPPDNLDIPGRVYRVLVDPENRLLPEEVSDDAERAPGC